MRIAIAYIADEDVNSQEDLRGAIGRVESLLAMNQFALVDENNVVYTRYTTYTGGSRHEFLSEDHLYDRMISIASSYGSSKQLCLAIPTPDLFIMGKPFKACFIQFDIDDIVDLLALDNQGRTHFALYSKNGSNLSGTELGPVISNHNFLEAIKGIVSEEVWKENCTNFADNAEGTLSFGSGNSHETLCYVPIEDTDWEMAVLIRESVIQEQIRHISDRNLETSRRQIIFTSVSVLALAVILLLQIGKHSRKKIEEEKETSRNFFNMANTDSMTGVRNKHAYSEMETIIDSQIANGELNKLGVVIGDINGLKQVNDTQGHAAGDKLIKDASALICEYFSHGAVFRIGGDEFVVLLQGEGYETMHEVISELNRKVEANIEDNAVVISIGYSVLEQDDQYLSDVFERADKMMYERKKELKSLGAPTGRS
jgi:diguanylate cyclase (GGDEF)-like protein